MRVKVVQTPKPRTGYRFVLYPLVLLLLLVLLAGYLVNHYLERELVKAVLNQQTGMLIHIRDVDVHALQRSVRITGIEMVSRVDSGSKIALEILEVKRLRLIPFLRKGDIKLGEVIITNLAVSGKYPELVQGLQRKGVLHVDSVKAKEAGVLEIGRFQLSGVEMNVSHFPGSIFRVRCSDLLLNLDDLRIDMKDSVQNIPDVFGKLRFEMIQPFLVFKNGFYAAKAARLAINLEDSVFQADSFRLIPQYNPVEFAEKYGKQTDRFDLSIEKLGVMGVDFKAILESKGLYARKVQVGHLKVLIFRDKNIPFDYSHFPALPQSALCELRFPLQVNHIAISNSRVEYQEVMEGGGEPGIVFISDMHVDVENLHSPESERITATGMAITGTGRLYGEGVMNVSVIMPLNVSRDTFSFSGTLRSMKFEAFNPMAMTNGHIRFDSGILDSVYFQAGANNDHATGMMKMFYQDVAFSLLKRDKPERHKQGFVSFMANTVVHKSNLSSEKHFRVAEMYFTRDKNKGVINYLWKTVFSGMKNTMKPGGKLYTERPGS